MRHYHRIMLSGAILATVPAFAVSAQTVVAPATTTTPTSPAPENGIGDIVVTAQKRAENIQKVPLSIVAQSGAQLAKAGIEDPTQLRQIVPNLQIIPIAQAAGVMLVIRGFGSASNAAIDPDVAAYVDGVFVPRPGAALTSFLDVANVEVLRGPQGTLFGRNSTVGAIAITTNAPSLTARTLTTAAEYSSYNTYQAQAVANLPVSSTFALRVAGLVGGTDGFVHNSFDGKTYGANTHYLVRVSGKWEITPTLTWLVRADVAHTNGDGVNYNAIDVATASAAQLAAYRAHLGAAGATLSNPPSFDAHQRFDANLTDSQWGLSSDLNWDVGGGFALRLLDSYRSWKNQQSDGDVIYTTLDILNRDIEFRSKAQSHELQLISPKSLLNDRLSFVAGLYFFREDYQIDTTYDIGANYCSFAVAVAAPALLPACNTSPHQNALISHFGQIEKSLAGYAQGDLKLTSKLTLTLGGRVTRDTKTGSYDTVTPNAAIVLLGAAEDDPGLAYKKTQATYRANLSWQVTPDILGFASYSTGYKAGGFSSAVATPALTAATRTFQPETSQDYELGVKSTFFDRHLLFNANLFQTDISNFQDRTFNGVAFIVRNSGDIRARGVEAQVDVVPFRNLTISLGGDYLNSIYSLFTNAPGLPGCTGKAGSCPTTQNLTGRPSTYAPRFQGNAAIEYTTPDFMNGYRVRIRPDASYEDGFYSTNDLNPQGYINARVIADLRVSLLIPGDRFTLTAFATNLADKRYFTEKFPQALDSLLGVRVPSTGATLYRGYIGDPRRVGVKFEARF